MYSPVHATIGALLAEVAPNPPVAFGLGLVSHYVLDAIPHGDMKVGAWLRTKHTGQRLALTELLDLGLAIFMVWFLIGHSSQTPGTIVAGAVGGITPDLLWGGRLILQAFPWRVPVVSSALDWHSRIHEYGHAKLQFDVSFRTGLIVQLGFLALVLVLYLHQ